MASNASSAGVDIKNKTVLIKLHYFLFFGGMAPVLPFMLVLSLQLGASVMLMGTVGAMVLLLTVLLKPFISALADAFPKTRKVLFVSTVLLTCLSLGGMAFVPPFVEAPTFSKTWTIPKQSILATNVSASSLDNLSALLERFGPIPNCSVDCAGLRFCAGTEGPETSGAFVMWTDLVVVLPQHGPCQLRSGRDCQYTTEGSPLLQLQLANSSVKRAGADTEYSTYFVSAPEGSAIQCTDLHHYSESLGCVGGEWNPSECGGDPLQSPAFWGFLFLMGVASVAYTTANTFTDAITVDSLGPGGNYGSQRLWGSVGWGVMGPIGGLLVDWWSGGAQTKDYTPAFFLLFVIMGSDVVLSTQLKVPALQPGQTVWGAVKPLLRRVHFQVFLLFSVVNGALCSVPFIYLFVLQEERAAETSRTQHVKLLQGLTVFVRSIAELPCMHFSDRVSHRLGAARFLSIILVLHSLRMSLTAAAGSWWPVWTTLLVELLNGPCYGFGYPAVVLYAKLFSPPGLSNTVQSLANVCYDILGYAIASVLSGYLITELGTVNMFLVWAAVGVITCLLHVLYTACCSPGDPEDASMTKESLEQPPRDGAADGLLSSLQQQPNSHAQI